jgi:cell division septation protein DedD
MSREAELYKDKIEVSLDGRQIFYLFFGGSVVVGLVFVLGVMVGRRVEARGHVDRARVAATVDPLAALDRLEGGSALSFQGALRGGDAPASDVEKQIAALEVKPAAPVDPKKADKNAKVDPKADAAKKASEEAAKADAAKKADEARKADEAKKAELAKAEAKKLEDAKKTMDDLAKVEAKKAEAKQAEEAKKAVAAAEASPPKQEPKQDAPKKRYTLQLSAFQERTEAEALVATVKAAGYDAYIAEGVVDGKQYFRVRTGTYKSQEAASAAKAEVEKVSNKAAIVTRL